MACPILHTAAIINTCLFKLRLFVVIIISSFSLQRTKTFWPQFHRRLLHIDIDMKNLASKMQLMNLLPDFATGGTYNFTTRTESAFRKKSHKNVA